MRGRRGTIIVENIIFIVLNVLFILTLTLFLSSKTGNSAVLEEVYAKQIALIIDSAKPGMVISLNMHDAVERAKKDWGENKIDSIVYISGNLVTVKLRERGGYSYSFFNDVEATTYFDNDAQEYIFVINKKNE